MKFNDIKIGQFFTIGETPSYPKLRTSYGYIDFRDEIKKMKEDISEGWNFRTMELEEVFKQLKRFDISIEDIQSEKERLLNS